MFTNYFIKKKIQALVSDAGGRPHRSLSLDEARSLLVLYNIEDHEDVMRALEPLRRRRISRRVCMCRLEERIFLSTIPIFLYIQRAISMRGDSLQIVSWKRWALSRRIS